MMRIILKHANKLIAQNVEVILRQGSKQQSQNLYINEWERLDVNGVWYRKKKITQTQADSNHDADL